MQKSNTSANTNCNNPILSNNQESKANTSNIENNNKIIDHTINESLHIISKKCTNISNLITLIDTLENEGKTFNIINENDIIEIIISLRG